jgi:hypothetical protein
VTLSMSWAGFLVDGRRTGASPGRDRPRGRRRCVVVGAGLVLLASSCSSNESPRQGPQADLGSTTTVVSDSATTTSFEALVSGRDEIEARYQAGVPLFDYDQSASLGIDESQPVNEGHHTVQDLRFTSPKGGQVIATVVTPQGPGPFAALILVDADDRLDWLFLARDYADNLDVLSIMIDPPLARLPEVDRPALGFALTERDREEQIQFVIDLRRTIDLLAARPDVDPGRIGVRAWGVGAEYGALLAGVEDRVGAYQLVDLVGGPVTFLSSTDPTDPDTKAFWDLAAEQQEA